MIQRWSSKISQKSNNHKLIYLERFLKSKNILNQFIDFKELLFQKITELTDSETTIQARFHPRQLHSVDAEAVGGVGPDQEDRLDRLQ